MPGFWGFGCWWVLVFLEFIDFWIGVCWVAGASRSPQSSKSRKQHFDGNGKSPFRYTPTSTPLDNSGEFLEKVASKALSTQVWAQQSGVRQGDKKTKRHTNSREELGALQGAFQHPAVHCTRVPHTQLEEEKEEVLGDLWFWGSVEHDVCFGGL
jgi:hypothetical protein